ncbi:MAG: bacteriophage-like protein [Xanthobacteraceae bacterium]|nr:MAG: bacteriophage-like protein [Xanthobacteraceae bacterium]
MIPDPSSLDVFDGAEDLEHVWYEGLKPDPLLTVSEWADRYRVLSSKSASEPGRWRTARTPYLRRLWIACRRPARCGA